MRCVVEGGYENQPLNGRHKAHSANFHTKGHEGNHPDFFWGRQVVDVGDCINQPLVHWPRNSYNVVMCPPSGCASAGRPTSGDGCCLG